MYPGREQAESCLSAGDFSAQREIQQALLIFIRLILAEPLSSASVNQHDPVLILIRNKLEAGWLVYERERYGTINDSLKEDNIVQQLRELWSSHIASHHPLFDFLATEASEQQIYYFFKSDSALNLLFFDLVSMTLVGSLPETRGENQP